MNHIPVLTSTISTKCSQIKSTSAGCRGKFPVPAPAICCNPAVHHYNSLVQAIHLARISELNCQVKYQFVLNNWVSCAVVLIPLGTRFKLSKLILHNKHHSQLRGKKSRCSLYYSELDWSKGPRRVLIYSNIQSPMLTVKVHLFVLQSLMIIRIR